MIETDRLKLRRFVVDDAAFVVALFNEPSFIRFIGDRGIRTVDEARAYITKRFLDAYASTELGPYVVERKGDTVPIGFCTLFRRDWLDSIDLGFAFLPAYWSQGFAQESARALMELARARLGVRRLVAIASVDNETSVRLLDRLGFVQEGVVTPPDAAAQVKLFAVDLSGAVSPDGMRHPSLNDPAGRT